jgi:hypothetical protein
MTGMTAGREPADPSSCQGVIIKLLRVLFEHAFE